MTYISIGIEDVRINYNLNGTGPPIVLLHGWLCNRTFWKEQLSILSVDHQVLSLDLRGHGESDSPERGYDLETLAHDVHTVINTLGLRPTTMVGHSMGGIVAQHMAINYPEDIAGLILVTTTGAAAEDTLISKRIIAAANELGYESALLQHYIDWFHPTTNINLMKWVIGQMLLTPKHVARRLVAAFGNTDFRDHIKHIDTPTLVLGASSDVSTPESRSRELFHLIPKANLTVIEDAGHFVQLERPHQFNGAIRQFLSESGL